MVTLEHAKRWDQLPRRERRQRIQSLLDNYDNIQAMRFLDVVRAPQGYGTYASMGPNYQFAVFGRDSLAVAEDIMPIWPELSREILLLLASLQGLAFDPASEEEPGKIHHEYRSRRFAGQHISMAAEEILSALYGRWGGKDGTLCYYGSVDATPLFVRVAAKYCEIHEASMLEQVVLGRDGQERPFKTHLRMATEWIQHKIEASPWHLLEFKRLNPDGLPYQAWKDSDHAYLHLDGSRANADGGIASAEIQGLAYDALHAAAKIAAPDAQQAAHWRHAATVLSRQTLRLLWMPDQAFFAMGCDRAPDGSTRQIATLTSNACAMLDSGILSELPLGRRLSYAKPVAQRITSSDFLTTAGIRTRALRHAGLLDFTDYHGSLVVWPRETLVAARGLRRQGFTAAARQLETRTLAATAKAGEFYEFFLANRSGSVKYHYRNESQDEPAFHLFGSANTPEPGQAWTISGVIRAAYSRRTIKKPGAT